MKRVSDGAKDGTTMLTSSILSYALAPKSECPLPGMWRTVKPTEILHFLINRAKDKFLRLPRNKASTTLVEHTLMSLRYTR